MYQYAQLIEGAAAIADFESNKVGQQLKPVSTDVLSKIISGAKKSDFLSEKIQSLFLSALVFPFEG